MNSVFVDNLTLSLFGESHGKAIGIVIDGLPPGFTLDMEDLWKEMDRRRPGRNSLSTPRKETDEVEILSGLFEGKTTGAPLCGMIPSKDTKSKDYGSLKDLMRPGHSDYPGYVHYRGFNDYRGGGHFSGRLTAPIVFAGSICKQYLKAQGITIGAHIKQLHNIEDRGFEINDLTVETLEELKKETLPVLNKPIASSMETTVHEAKKEQDSVGGIIECAVIGLPAGIGNPFFHSLESKIAQLIFSVPAVKGVTFGAGFDIAGMKGSQSNDSYFVDEHKKVQTKTNYNGGILGGISTGMPIVFQTIVKATPSISQEQLTFNKETMENETLVIEGRHDPCIIPRAIPVIESMVAIALFNACLEDLKWT